MDILKIKKDIENTEEKEVIYLIEKLSDKHGFFKHDGKLYFMELNSEGIKGAGVATDKLELHINVPIKSLDKNSDFPSDNYNIIWFKELKENDNLECFLSLCLSYVKTSEKINIIDFFNGIQSIFATQRETEKKNLIGLFGEVEALLVLLINGIDFVGYWHENSFDKYDIVTEEKNYEVKTTIKDDNYVHIKHDQLFNDRINENGLIFVKIYEDNSGETLFDIIDQIKNIRGEDLTWDIKIEKELRKVDIDKAKTKRFGFKELKIYNASDINALDIIPSEIKNVNYELDLNIHDPSHEYYKKKQ